MMKIIRTKRDNSGTIKDGVSLFVPQDRAVRQRQQQQRPAAAAQFQRLCWSVCLLTAFISSVTDALSDSDVFDAIEALQELPYLTEEAPMYEDASSIASQWPHQVYSPIAGIQFCVQPILYEALPYKDKPITKVFAWMSIPCDSDLSEKVPGVVLVHGGGGTAWVDWCERWSRRGYASISIAVEGQTDVLAKSSQGIVLEGAKQLDLKWKLLEEAGPFNIPHEPYRDSSESIRDQWMYHAVADTLLAHSLLQSFPSIDSNSIGLHGVSWGSIIGLTTLPLVPEKFAFYVDQYGCGSLSSDSSNRSILGEKLKRRPLNKEAYERIWDPSLRLGSEELTTPILFLGAPGDIYFPMENVMHTYHTLPSSEQFMTSFQFPKLVHHHNVWSDGNEAYAFADSVLENNQDSKDNDVPSFWITQVGVHHSAMSVEDNDHHYYTSMMDEDYVDFSNLGEDEHPYMEVIFSSTKHLVFGELIYTTDKAFGPTHRLLGQITSRQWHSQRCGLTEIPATCDSKQCGWRVGGLVPIGAQSWYFLVHAEESSSEPGLLMASSRIINRLQSNELE